MAKALPNSNGINRVRHRRGGALCLTPFRVVLAVIGIVLVGILSTGHLHIPNSAP